MTEKFIGANKYEKFITKVVNRSDIFGIDYNPRKIGSEERKKLKGFLESPEFGLLSPLCLNENTGNIFSGNQRLSILDQLHHGKPYKLTISAAHLTEKQEAAAVVFMNNQDAQGDWDTEKLHGLKDMFEFQAIDMANMGFTDESMNMLGISDMIFNDLPEQLQSVAEEEKQKYRSDKKKIRDKMRNINEDGDGLISQSDFTVTFIFPDSKSKQEWMKNIGMKPTETRLNSKILQDLFTRGKC